MKAQVKSFIDTAEFIETPMSISEFNTNARYEDIRSIISFIINLIFMVPGTIPEMPLMGYDLHSRRHYIMNEETIFDQQRELQEQISTYCNHGAISSTKLYPALDERGEQTLTVIQIELSTGETVSISDDGEKNIKIGVSTIGGKDFTK